MQAKLVPTELQDDVCEFQDLKSGDLFVCASYLYSLKTGDIAVVCMRIDEVHDSLNRPMNAVYIKTGGVYYLSYTSKVAKLNSSVLNVSVDKKK